VTFTLSILNPATKEVLEKATFSKLFNREVHSWGKNNFVSIRGLTNGTYTINDTIIIGAEVCSVKEIAHDIEVNPHPKPQTPKTLEWLPRTDCAAPQHNRHTDQTVHAQGQTCIHSEATDRV
jgi:hypothetical protein